MNEAGKYEVYRKKLQGICDENNLVYRFRADKYPIMLTVQTTGSLDGQMTMLERAEEDGYRSPDAQLVFAYKGGDLVYKISETFTIGDALFNKLKNLFKNMHTLWLQFFHREIVENNLLVNLPHISDDAAESELEQYGGAGLDEEDDDDDFDCDLPDGEDDEDDETDTDED